MKLITDRKDYEEKFRTIDADFALVAEHSPVIANYVGTIRKILRRYDRFAEELKTGIEEGLPFKSRLREMLQRLSAEADHHRKGLAAKI